jgi:hypothetical protein
MKSARVMPLDSSGASKRQFTKVAKPFVSPSNQGDASQFLNMQDVKVTLAFVYSHTNLLSGVSGS